MGESEYEKAIGKLRRRLELLEAARKGRADVQRVSVKKYHVRAHDVRAHTRLFYRLKAA